MNTATLLKNLLAYLWSIIVLLIAITGLSTNIFFSLLATILAICLAPIVRDKIIARLGESKAIKPGIFVAYILSFVLLGAVGNSENELVKQKNIESDLTAAKESNKKAISKPKPTDFDYNLQSNLQNLGLFLKCSRLNGNANQSGDVYWVGISKDIDKKSMEFRFPHYRYGSAENYTHSIILQEKEAFLFYRNEGRPNDFPKKMQYGAGVSKTESSYKFHGVSSVASPKYSSKDYTLKRDTGVLTIYDDKYGDNRQYGCSAVNETQKSDIFTTLYSAVHNYAINTYDQVQAEFDKEINNRKF
jgi:hypothetical protein